MIIKKTKTKSSSKMDYSCLSCGKIFVDYIYKKRRTCSCACSAKLTKNSPFKKGSLHIGYKHGQSYESDYKKQYGLVYKEKNKTRTSILNKIWYRENKESVLEKRRNYYQNFYEKVLTNARNQKAKRKGVEGKHTSKEWASLKEFYENTCLRCGRREPEIKLTVDHVVPIKKGGSNFIENIQPLCLTCNLEKSIASYDYRDKSTRDIKTLI